jgi:AcrR family transcriptional regulator
MFYTVWYVSYSPVSRLMSTAPLTREARKVQTREAIVAAATKLFSKAGIEATSLDRIANEIGLTKGAIYSTFSSKDELVEAVATANAITVSEDQLFDPKIPIKEVLRLLATEVMVVRKKLTRDRLVLFLELFLYERRHGSWGKRVLAENRAALEEEIPRLEQAMKERGESLVVPATEFFTALNAIAIGVVLQLERDPESLSNESVVKLFESIAG